MKTGLFSHADFTRHVNPAGHAESVDRIRAVNDALGGADFDGLIRHDADKATHAQLLLVHSAAHIDHVMNSVPEDDIHMLDPDTFMSPGSLDAALRAAGAVCGAVDRVMAGDIKNAFCAVRPPGHHAEPDRAMGFCLFNNVAVGACYARQNHGIGRIAIIDFDVHHGNGTQTVVERTKDFFYGSSHQAAFYPGTGHSGDRGDGVIVNVPLDMGSGSTAFRAAYENEIFPALEEFRPDFLLISAGFDAHYADPLAGLNVKCEDFSWVTERLMDIADSHCQGRLVSTLEGGYDTGALAESAAAHVLALMR